MPDLLVEDGDAAEGTAQPLGVVLLELGVDRLEEGPDEGHLPSRARDRSLVPDVRDCEREGGLSAKGPGPGETGELMAQLTLVIGDEDGENSRKDCPGAGVGEIFDEGFDLGRDIDGAKFNGRQRRGGRVGSHCASWWWWRSRSVQTVVLVESLQNTEDEDRTGAPENNKEEKRKRRRASAASSKARRGQQEHTHTSRTHTGLKVEKEVLWEGAQQGTGRKEKRKMECCHGVCGPQRQGVERSLPRARDRKVSKRRTVSEAWKLGCATHVTAGVSGRIWESSTIPTLLPLACGLLGLGWRGARQNLSGSSVCSMARSWGLRSVMQSIPTRLSDEPSPSLLKPFPGRIQQQEGAG
ncbi:hypothetical protein VTJ49DRAFT_5639 [Mycothermus thermophilus]|uniref:Uncharacterized protein n=1 Tax=Humicola insolens TaxID=85995 RepID=A0ABR3V442_HUMIN